jgi:YVTN family beta-propeller protein
MSRPGVRLLKVLLLASLAAAPSLWARDFIVVATIPVGEYPEGAVLRPDGKELYVANRNGGTVSVIDTATRQVTRTLTVGPSPHALVVRHDGRAVYLLVEGAMVVVQTGDKSMQRYDLPNRSDDLALTPDDRTLYISRVYTGVARVDTATLRMDTPLDMLCPIGLAMDPAGKRLYVSYQCAGPGGRPGHDAIEVYALPSLEPLGTIAGPPNVGGQVLLSPDGRQLWVNGNDACSQPAYDHEGCPLVPGRTVNVISTADLKLIKTLTFSLDQGNGVMSFSPQGEAFVGGGLNLKVVPETDLNAVQEMDIAAAGSVVFLADGRTAFATMGDKNAVAVLAEWRDPSQAAERGVASLSLCSVLAMLQAGDCPLGGTMGRVDDQRIVSLIQEREIEFPLTPEIEKQLAQADKSGVVVDAVVNRYLLSLTRAKRP